MKKILAIAVIIFITISCYAQADGWVSLFDGKTMNGWHKYGGGAAGSAWKIEDGTLYLDTSTKGSWQIANGGDIVTDKEYENFDLTLEWKISPEAIVVLCLTCTRTR